MSDPTMALMAYLDKCGLQMDHDVVREGIRVLIQSVIEAEVTQRFGARPHERSECMDRCYFSQESMRKLPTPKERARELTAPLHVEPIRQTAGIGQALKADTPFGDPRYGGFGGLRVPLGGQRAPPQWDDTVPKPVCRAESSHIGVMLGIAALL